MTDISESQPPDISAGGAQKEEVPSTLGTPEKPTQTPRKAPQSPTTQEETRQSMQFSPANTQAPPSPGISKVEATRPVRRSREKRLTYTSHETIYEPEYYFTEDKTKAIQDILNEVHLHANQTWVTWAEVLSASWKGLLFWLSPFLLGLLYLCCVVAYAKYEALTNHPVLQLPPNFEAIASLVDPAESLDRFSPAIRNHHLWRLAFLSLDDLIQVSLSEVVSTIQGVHVPVLGFILFFNPLLLSANLPLPVNFPKLVFVGLSSVLQVGRGHKSRITNSQRYEKYVEHLARLYPFVLFLLFALAVYFLCSITTLLQSVVADMGRALRSHQCADTGGEFVKYSSCFSEADLNKVAFMKLVFPYFTVACPPLSSALSRGLYLAIPWSIKRGWSMLLKMQSVQNQLLAQVHDQNWGNHRVQARLEELRSENQPVDSVHLVAAQQTVTQLAKLGLLEDHLKFFESRNQPAFLNTEEYAPCSDEEFL